ncbi:MAG: galactose oxidase-like domain-containing protein [Planctomycetota bacterium]
MNSSAPAQASVTGVWLTGIKHDVTGPNATDYLAPFRSTTTSTGFLPNFAFGKVPVTGLPTVFNWGWPEPLGTFNAIHMSLIPKGPLQGRLLVWNRYAVVLRPGLPFDGTNFWAFQAYSIINPDPNASAPRFQNFLLPLLSVGPTQPTGTDAQLVADLFCSGHAWSPFGDLVVAGGAEYIFDPSVPSITELGAKFLYLFDPTLPTSVWPGQPASAPPLYPSPQFLGRWIKPTTFELSVDRYYPTVMLTHRLSRLSGLVETMIVAGGQDPIASILNSNNDPSFNDPRNTFESFKVRASTASSFLEQDPWPLASGQLVFRGPGTSSSPYRDWLEQYPRLHLLSNGRAFRSGWAPVGASLDTEDPPNVLGAWDTTIGATSSTWNYERVDGSSVFFARRGPQKDLVFRFCGKSINTGLVTRTAEFCFASTPSAPWQPLSVVPDESPGNGRVHANVVILPDASMLVLGGEDPTYGPILTMAIHKMGVGWTTPFGSLGTPTVRDYHSTTLLLPTGQVFVGGGEHRGDVTAGTPSPHDYDIYEPAYLHSGPRPTAVTLPGVAQDSDGTYLLSNGQQNYHVTCELEDSAYLDKVVLMAPGSITHHSDMSARYFEPQSVAVSSTERTFDTPDQMALPHGYYMLFALSDGRIPANAVWVKL